MSNFDAIFKDQWCIGQEFFDHIGKLIKPGDTIVELGSGRGTTALCSKYNVYSIEHNPQWVNKIPQSHYIYAPLKPYKISAFPTQTQWYDIEVLKAQLPQKYDLIIVDGPTGATGRGGFHEFLHLFKGNVPIMFDDVNRGGELQLAKLVGDKLKRSLDIYKAEKHFAVVGHKLVVEKSIK